MPEARGWPVICNSRVRGPIACGSVYGALPGHAGGGPGDLEGWSRVCSSRSSLAGERIDHVIGDSGLSLLLTDASASRQALQTHHPRLKVIELEWRLARYRAERQAGVAAARSRAQPGVYDIHLGVDGSAEGGHDPPSCRGRAVCGRPGALGDRLGRPSVLQFTPLSFDASVEQIFATLSVGATLVLADSASLRTRGRSATCWRHIRSTS